jgi:hypothetical protein
MKTILAVCLAAVSLVAVTPDASAVIVIKTQEPLTLVPGETTVRFTGEYEVFVDYRCDVVTNYIQNVIIHNPGLPGGSTSARVYTEYAGRTGSLLMVVGYTPPAPCEGWLFFEAESNGGDTSPSRTTASSFDLLMSFPIQLWSVLFFQ